MNPSTRSLVFAMVLISVGSGWLLTTLGVMPGVVWVWALGLAIVGLLSFLVGGFDKVTFVVGTFFIVASVLSVIRQTGRMSLDVEVPILVILFGVLILVARLPLVPAPTWIIDDRRPDGK